MNPEQWPKTCLLLQSSTTTLSGLTALITLSTSEADSREICVVPIIQIASGSTNSVLQGGTGPYWLFLTRTKVPFLAKSSNSGRVSAIAAVEVSRISFLKLKLGGGEGMTEAALHDDEVLVTELSFRMWDLRERWRFLEFGVKIGNGDGEAFMLTSFCVCVRERFASAVGVWRVCISSHSGI